MPEPRIQSGCDTLHVLRGQALPISANLASLLVSKGALNDFLFTERFSGPRSYPIGGRLRVSGSRRLRGALRQVCFEDRECFGLRLNRGRGASCGAL
jgi:hypothetical protein